ncbi:hypothetical protein OAF27_02050 [Verrucomicrobiales bacterium]|nr:hypothetical protein [Verrucomicrobiales bacterium]
MTPYIWLFLKIWPAWVAAVALGFIVGWWISSRRSAARHSRLLMDLENAEKRSESAKAAETKSRNALAKRDRRIGELEKNSVSKNAVADYRQRADDAEAASREAEKAREAAEIKAGRLERGMVPKSDVVAADRRTAEAESGIAGLKRQIGDLERQLRAAPKPRVVHDLAGFSHEEKSSLELARGEIVKLNNEIDRLHTLTDAHVGAARGATDRVKGEAEKIKEERDAARAEVHAMINQPAPEKPEKKPLPEDVDELQKKLAESNDARDRLRGALDAVTSELEALKLEAKSGPVDMREHMKLLAERDSFRAQLDRMEKPEKPAEPKPEPTMQSELSLDPEPEKP